MKVGDLKEGMLVRAKGNWEIIDCDWPMFVPSRNSKSFKKSKRDAPGVTCSHCWDRVPNKEVMIFVGTTDDDWKWGGVKRHHRFLWKGKGVIMTGYDMRYLEPIEGEDNE